ncbi:glycosyltransferase [Saprospiraceae bacterium]|nr:glycosyltransferase [Saprospiraceae bacterium]
MKYIEKYLKQRCDNSLEVPNHVALVDMIVVMPTYDEEESVILEVTESLKNQDTKDIRYAVYILINTHEKDSQELINSSEKLHQSLTEKLTSFNSSHCSFHVFYNHYNVKKSGVGHARKSLMDTAFRYFQSNGRNGIIVNIDADTCCSINYIHEIYNHFKKNPDTEAASIRYEHIIPIDTHPIIDYELHLRYFINMQRLINLPYAYQTVGSAMAVRSESYVKEGGMNRRQAGEDFYFIHKYSKNLSLSEINTAYVTPSPRKSGRVPFGTGKAVSDASKEDYIAMSYNYDSFIVIGKWVSQNLKVLLDKDIKTFDYQVSSSDALNIFLDEINAEASIRSLMLNSDNQLIRYKSFFVWFNAFQLMKCLHYLRDNGFPDQPIDICIKRLFLEHELVYSESRKENLLQLREVDKSSEFKSTMECFL